MKTHRNRGRGRAAPTALAALAMAASLAAAACDDSLVDAIDNLRAAAPTVCKDYCEDKLACEWPAAAGDAEDDAFSAAVQRCTVECGCYMGLGAYAARPGTEQDVDFFDRVPGGALRDALECGLEAGAFRCTDATPTDQHAFGAVVQSMCDDADACLDLLGIDQHLVWTPSAEGGGTCAAQGSEWLDAEFFAS